MEGGKEASQHGTLLRSFFPSPFKACIYTATSAHSRPPLPSGPLRTRTRAYTRTRTKTGTSRGRGNTYGLENARVGCALRRAGQPGDSSEPRLFQGRTRAATARGHEALVFLVRAFVLAELWADTRACTCLAACTLVRAGGAGFDLARSLARARPPNCECVCVCVCVDAG